MRTLFIVLALLACCGFTLNAWAVKPPSVSEREARLSNPDQQKKAHWFGRKGRTGCECGASKVNPNKCYHPKEGQYCCNPTTGHCTVVKPTKYNIPFKD